MKTPLAIAGLLVLALMLSVTVTASLHQDIFSAAQKLWPDPWFRATLADAYCGFFLFWLWVAWREGSWSRGAVWFLLIMTLGNIATAGYLLLQLKSLKRGEGIQELLLRKEPSCASMVVSCPRFGVPGLKISQLRRKP